MRRGTGSSAGLHDGCARAPWRKLAWQAARLWSAALHGMNSRFSFLNYPLRKLRSAFLGPCNMHWANGRSEEHTSELQSLMRISYAVFCLKKKNRHTSEQYVDKTTHRIISTD